jgi:hypothetical protein
MEQVSEAFAQPPNAKWVAYRLSDVSLEPPVTFLNLAETRTMGDFLSRRTSRRL